MDALTKLLRRIEAERKEKRDDQWWRDEYLREAKRQNRRTKAEVDAWIETLKKGKR